MPTCISQFSVSSEHISFGAILSVSKEAHRLSGADYRLKHTHTLGAEAECMRRQMSLQQCLLISMIEMDHWYMMAYKVNMPAYQNCKESLVKKEVQQQQRSRSNEQKYDRAALCDCLGINLPHAGSIALHN